MTFARLKLHGVRIACATLLGLGSFGCIDGGVDVVIDAGAPDANEAGAPAGGQPRDNAPGGVDDIQDGTRNTIQIDETPPAEDAPPGGNQPPRGDAGAPTPAADDSAAIADLTRTLGDKFLTFGDSSFFSSGSITDNNELQLCAFGRFGMRVTRVTSTSFDTFSSEETFIGVWSVKEAGGQFVLELVVEDATDPNNVGVQQRRLTIDAAGNLFIDGVRTEAVDAAADCAAAERQP